MSYISQVFKGSMDERFKKHLPDSLYMDHYTLADELGGDPGEWSEFLKDPDNKRFIEREIATIAESAARKALNTLGNGTKITSQEVAALKEILNKSQLINQKGSSKEKVIITYIPKKESDN